MKSPKRKSDPNIYPPGWDHARVKAIADYYDARKDVDVLHDAEVTRAEGPTALIKVPRDFVADVQKTDCPKENNGVTPVEPN